MQRLCRLISIGSSYFTGVKVPNAQAHYPCSFLRGKEPGPLYLKELPKKHFRL